VSRPPADRSPIARVTPWDAPAPPDEAVLRARFAAEGLAPHTWSNGPHYQYAPHTHPYHKVLYVLSGEITFELPATGQALTLRPGDRLDLPPGTVHAARVGPAGVTCLEAPRG
jgi:mannose-6-phosphate isomerase-like protein (cupin superfamily)